MKKRMYKIMALAMTAAMVVPMAAPSAIRRRCCEQQK